MIKNQGKFEGEKDYAPYFYDLASDGDAFFDDEHGTFTFTVTDEDRAKYPELGDRVQVAFVERSDGFWVEVEP